MNIRFAARLTLGLLNTYKTRSFSIISKCGSGVTAMSLCFLEAFKAKEDGRISEKEYIGHLTAHLRGIRHDSDKKDDPGHVNYLRFRDEFGSLFRRFSLSSRTLSTEETELYNQLLQQCFEGDLEALKSTFTKFENESLQIPLNALAAIVAKKGRPDILEFLLQKGATFSEEVNVAATWSIGSSVEMLEYLWNKNWRDIQHSQTQQAHVALMLRHKPVNLLEFLLRKKAKLNPEVFDMSDSGTLSLPVVQLIVEACGTESLREKRVFSLAVEEGNRDVVEYLCKLRVSINDIPSESDRREPFATYSPLWTTVKKRDISMMELLLEYGADPNAPYESWNSQSLLDGVRKHHSDASEMLVILEKYAATEPSGHKI